MTQARRQVDALERARGATQRRPRVKLASWDELLSAAGEAGGA